MVFIYTNNKELKNYYNGKINESNSQQKELQNN